MQPTDTRSSTLRGDLFGGVTAGIVALPLALAFGVQSGLGATFGLYGAIFVGFFAALFGGTPTQISGPTGPMTVVTAGAVLHFAEATGSVESALPALVATFLLAGVFLVVMGATGIGTLIKYVPYPAVSGFMSGIGVIIVMLQLFPAAGLSSPGSTIDVARSLGTLWSDRNDTAVLLTIATVAIIYAFPRLTRKVPSVLVALISVSLTAALLDLDVPVIGDIPSGFPELRLDGLLSIDPHLTALILEFAVTLAALGSIDSLLTSVVADKITKTRHDSNRELIGQGVGNAVSALFCGLPGAGATMRTVVNVSSGGRTRLSGVVHALVLLTVLLGAGTLAAHIPKPVLAGILFTVGLGILDYRGIRHLHKVPKADAAVKLLVLFVTVFFDLLVAVGIGVTMASLLFMRRMSQAVEDGVELERVSAYQDEQGWPDEHIPPEIEQDVLVKPLTGPIFFGAATAFQQQLRDLPQVRFVILRMRRVPFVDQSGAYAIEEAARALEQRGVTVLITGLQEQPGDLLRRLRVVPDCVPEECTFRSFDQSIQFVRQRLAHDATPTD